ncbi:hypothetical protein B7R22_02220 [Subtercola boreus]|uniref:Uncharacterized protein n=1 Tax=Subtercola boreus TaxID=120213 RepID=A0A3E0W3V5_9MICO|nr:hypothetical protein B7R22_02220 [Subtercola boreus]
MEISNTTTSTLKVAAYPDAATITDGAFVGDAGHVANDLTSWTALSSSALQIPPGGAEQTTVTISVPPDAAPGEQYAVIWAEVSGTNDGAIAQNSRAGIRIYLSVSGNNPPASAFTVDTLTAQRDANGEAVAQAQVHKTGGRALDMSGTLTLSKATGSLTAGPYSATLATTLAPGQSEPVTILLSDSVDNGPWNATIDLQSGLLHENSQAQITFPDGPGSAPAATTTLVASPDPSTTILIVGLATASALVIIVLALLLLAQRRKKR